MSDQKIQAWVNDAPSPDLVRIRQAIHTVIATIARTPVLRESMYLKGGILLAIKHQSSRFTSDLDFSNPAPYSHDQIEFVKKTFNDAFPHVIDMLPYDLDCRVQSIQKRPNHKDATYPSLNIRVGFAYKGSRSHRRLLKGESPHVLDIDYSFYESVPFSAVLQVENYRTIQTYDLETLIAEKVRAMLQQSARKHQRMRRQDVYDIYYLIRKHGPFPATQQRDILAVLQQKCKDRDVDVGPHSLRHETVKSLSKKRYPELKDEIAEELPDFEMIYEAVCCFVEQLPWE